MGLESGGHLHANLVIGDDSFLQPPIAEASPSSGSTNPLNRDALGYPNWTQLYPRNEHHQFRARRDHERRREFFSWRPGMAQHRQRLRGDRKRFMDQGQTFDEVRNRITTKDFKTQTGNWGLEGSVNFSPSAQLPTDTGNGLANLMLGNFNTFSQVGPMAPSILGSASGKQMSTRRIAGRSVDA